jgi:hypothetical protein
MPPHYANKGGPQGETLVMRECQDDCYVNYPAVFTCTSAMLRRPDVLQRLNIVAQHMPLLVATCDGLEQYVPSGPPISKTYSPASCLMRMQGLNSKSR